jgi:hypothetical protein
MRFRCKISFDDRDFRFSSMEISFIAFGIQDLLTAFYSYTYLKAYDKEQVKTKK